MKITSCLRSQMMAAAVSLVLPLALSPVAHASIVGPYSPDTATLHLWHLDESGVPSADAASGGTNLVGLLNGATLGNVSFPGFGNSVNTQDGGQDLTAAANRDAAITPSAASQPANVAFPYCNSTNGAFTFEALVWIGFDPDKNLGTTGNGGNNRNAFCMIMACESTANASRIFQFRICPKGVAPGGTGNPAIAPQPLLTYENIRTVSGNQPTIFAAIPTNGPNAIVSNQWYHVAVSYNGIPNTADNIKFYWTLLDASRIAASQIPITSAQTTMNGTIPLGSVNSPFTIGNTGRNLATVGQNFLGQIDEVRISNLERKATEMMFFSSNPVVVVPPASQTVAQGDAAAFSVLSAGLPTLSYQWRHASTNLPGATLASLGIPSAQITDAGDYDVVITNNHGSTTSSVAILTVRLPLDLTWIGSAGDVWNTSLINWDSSADNVADAPYSERDHVTFSDAGSAVSTVQITNNVSPGSVTINSSSDYTLTTPNGSGLAGSSRIVKHGSGRFIIDTDNPFTGPTTINSGALQIGTGANRGSLGNGPLTNNGALSVLRSGALTFNNWLVGGGSLTNWGTNTITISGTNLMSGPIELNAGALVLANAAAKGAATEYVLHAAANSSGPSRLTVGGGVTFGPGTTIALLDSLSSPDYRCSLTTSDSTNTFSGNITLSGDGNINFASDGPAASSLFIVSAPQLNSPGYTGQLILRGNGNGLITSQITLGNKLSKTDGGVWTIASTGNSWLLTDVANGRLQLGANNALPTALTVNITLASAVLDLAGYNQTIDTLTGVGIVANSSTTADSVLTVQPSAVSLFNGVIQNATAGGTRKVAVTVSGGALTLGGTNTYTGETTISGGSLALFVEGSISNSAVVNVAAGATLDASLRSDGTFTVSPGQTLTGNGMFNVSGNLSSLGTIQLKVNKSGATLTSDNVNVSGAVTYGGTLRLNIAASPALTTSDAFQLFTAGAGYTGEFTDIIPGPGIGLAWDTSTLSSDGTLRIKTSTVPSTGTNLTFTMSGNTVDLSWPENYIGWRLQAQTNGLNVGLSSNWVDVSGSSTTNHISMPLNIANGCVFYRMVYP